MQNLPVQPGNRGTRAARWLLLLPLLWGAVWGQDTTTEYVNVSASGSGYYVCRLDGVQISQHSQEHTAAIKAGNLKLANPSLPVVCEQTKSLVATLTPAGRDLVAGTPPPPNSSVTLTWSAPTLNEDGTPITALPLTYSIYESGALVAAGIQTMTYVVEDLAPGSYSFTATATDAAGNESQHSIAAAIGVP